MTHRSDAGEITLGRAVRLGFVVFFVCLLFLFFDTKHRMAGYQAVHGAGIPGTITVTSCESRWLGAACKGNFVSADGRILRSDVRLNGITAMDTQALPAAIADEHADEVWAADGAPWFDLSAVQIAALVPFLLILTMIWTFLRGGPRTWRAQSHAMRSRLARDRASAHDRAVRMGRVH